MSVDIIPDPNPSNAFDGAALDTEYLGRIVTRCNIFNNMLVKDQNGNTLGRFEVSEGNLVLIINAKQCVTA